MPNGMFFMENGAKTFQIGSKMEQKHEPEWSQNEPGCSKMEPLRNVLILIDFGFLNDILFETLGPDKSLHGVLRGPLGAKMVTKSLKVSF